MKNLGYVICATADDGTEEYYAVDYNGGGYPYWGMFQSATIFETVESAQKALSGEDFTTCNLMSDGNYRPPRMLSSGAHLETGHMTGSVTITIEPLTLEDSVVTNKYHFALIPEKREKRPSSISLNEFEKIQSVVLKKAGIHSLSDLGIHLEEIFGGKKKVKT